MTPLDHPALENLHQRTTAMLTAIDDTPLESIDHVHYQHYCEELRLLIEEWLTATSTAPPDLPDQTWAITRHGGVVGVCTTATAAALTAGIPDLAFTPISLCPSAIDDLRALWLTEPPSALTSPVQ
ncbi:hypothetical protein GCM10023153_16730 [Ornithinibacter aureus]|uniref:Uncharacterized protein n=1 Tax=Ornithinibacter aureus TaxID=622664 RepID=A0ABP8JSB3_9MICO|nr:hypothetical protein [Ornithinibacter aureus]KAF0834361.1 hypothetical protein C8E84_2185 [Ornithinibacter aureus]